MFGLINLCKPSGISSREAINPIQRLARPAKVGHAGTLDPLANGVLVVTLGPATRLTSHIQTWPKGYRGTFLLGQRSDTEDVEGQLESLATCPRPARDELEQVLPQFRGTILQQPPAFSALKVKGQRAYALARQGITPQLEPRQVEIHELRILHYEYPELVLEVSCGSGTYLRSLGRDIARAVGSDAVMSALTRTNIGHLHIDHAVALEDVRAETLPDLILPAAEAVHDLPQVVLTEAQRKRVACGMSIQVDLPAPLPPRHLAALTSDGQLGALLIRRGSVYGPQRNFLNACS